VILVQVWVDEDENNSLPLCWGSQWYVLAMPRTMLPCPHIAPGRGRSWRGAKGSCDVDIDQSAGSMVLQLPSEKDAMKCIYKLNAGTW